jgi:hypothetical protein
MSCSPLKVNRRFGGTCRLHLQIGEQAKKESSVKQVAPLYVDTHGEGNCNVFTTVYCKLTRSRRREKQETKIQNSGACAKFSKICGAGLKSIRLKPLYHTNHHRLQFPSVRWLVDCTAACLRVRGTCSYYVAAVSFLIKFTWKFTIKYILK